MSEIYKVERWLCRYNNRFNHRLPCQIKGCKNKLKNGRCGLDMCRLELNLNDNLTGNCLDFTTKVTL